MTPPGSPRRFDTRFFVAALPDGAAVVPDPHEVADHRWITPADALAEMAAGAIDLWPPTSTTLQQLVAARDLDDVRRHLAPVRAAEARQVDAGSCTVRRPGHPRRRRRDPRPVGRRLPRRSSPPRGRRSRRPVGRGDGRDRTTSCATSAGPLTAILLTAPRARPRGRRGGARDPPRGRRSSPRPARPGSCRARSSRSRVADRLAFADVEIRVHATPGTHPDHLAFEVPGGGRRAGRGPRGSGSVAVDPEPVDAAALSRSRALVEALGERRLAAHR